MGIPKFYKNIIVPLFGARGRITREKAGTVRTLIIDGNALIHEVAAENWGYAKKLTQQQKDAIFALTEEERKARFEVRLRQKLREMSAIFKIPYRFVMAMDGVPPAAKMLPQQRTRRFRGAFLRTAKSNLPGATVSIFDSNCITMGTPFMMQVNEILINEFQQNSQYYGKEIIYNPHTTEGEGEHTVMNMFRNGTIPNEHLGITVVYGLDADWYVLAEKSGMDDIFLARGTTDFLNIVNTTKKFTDEKGGTYTSFHDDLEKRGIPIDDLILLLALLGNDFVPKQPSMYNMERGFRTALGVYQKLGIKLTKDGEINWTNWIAYLKEFARYEADLLDDMEVGKEDLVFNPESFSDQIQKLRFEVKTEDELRDKVYEYTRNGWYTRNFQIYGSWDMIVPIMQRNTERKVGGLDIQKFSQLAFKIASPTEEGVKSMVTQWMKMVAWYFYYYTKGYDTVRLDVYYNHFYAPLLCDIATYGQAAEVGSYLRPSPKMVAQWEVRSLLENAPRYINRPVLEWITLPENDGKQWVDLPDGPTNLLVREALFTKRALTQLALVIPPQSYQVLNKSQLGIITVPSLETIHPFSAPISVPSFDFSKKAVTLPEKIKLIEEEERLVYLPRLDYVTIHDTILKNENTDSRLRLSSMSIITRR